MNRADRRQVIATLSAECMDLAGVDFLKDGWVEPGSDERFHFDEVDYRGADLRDTVFPPYGGPKCSTPLQGADIRGARDAYHRGVAGIPDGFTKYDEDHCAIGHRGCGLDEGKLYCEPVPPRP